MRYISDIPNDFFKISLYTWNGKYIVKVEAGLYEQTYKVSELDFVGSEDDIRAAFANDVFLQTIAARFQQMHADFQAIIDL